MAIYFVIINLYQSIQIFFYMNVKLYCILCLMKHKKKKFIQFILLTRNEFDESSEFYNIEHQFRYSFSAIV